MNSHSFLRSATTLLLLIASAVGAPAAEITVYFSPRGGAATAIATKIDAAKSRVLVQAYSISQSQITTALLHAKARGVDVQLIVDPRQQSNLYSTAPKMHAAGLPVATDSAHQLQHNKSIVIDFDTVVTGSANFTTSAENDNAENTVIIVDQAVNKLYADNWALHRSHCKTYTVHATRYADPIVNPATASPTPPLPTTKDP